MPTKRVIILERQSQRAFTAVFWYDVPTSRQPFYANATFVSAYRDTTGPELASLRLGAVVEEVVALSYPAGLTAGQIESAVEQTWTEGQARVTAYNPWSLHGRYWPGDGSAWVPGGVT
jgi:hypothetical protein